MLATAADDALELAGAHADFGDRSAVAHQHRHYVPEAPPEDSVGVDVDP